MHRLSTICSAGTTVEHVPQNLIAMFQNNLKIGWRNLGKNKVYTFINVFGQTVGDTLTIKFLI